MNPGIFREYDIRGIADQDLTDDVARRIGRGFASLVKEKGGKTVALGRDVRPSSPRIRDRLSEGIRAAGLDVIDHGVVPTPLLYFSMHTVKPDGGMMVTGSHNPPEYNGVKLCLGAHTLFGDEIRSLRDRIAAGSFASGLGSERTQDVIEPYVEYLSARFRLSRPVRCVVDAGNGVGGLVAPRLFRAIGAEVEELFCEPDGRFPNHHPDPTVLENLGSLIERVAATRADMGIGFDGDADRIGLVSEQGEPVFGDRILLLYARDILSRIPGATFICDIKCSDILVEDTQKRGGRMIMWKTGHSLTKQKMKDEKALLAGEMSGHMFFGDEYFGFDDAIYAACRMLRIVADSGEPLSRLLADVPRVETGPEIRVDCPDSDKFRIVDEIALHLRGTYKTIDIDGVRVLFDKGWGLLRASNTQPVLVLRFEARDKESLAEIRSIIADELARFSLKLP